MIGAKMMLEGKWMKPGVWNMEQMDPDPFMDDMNLYGFPGLLLIGRWLKRCLEDSIEANGFSEIRS